MVPSNFSNPWTLRARLKRVHNRRTEPGPVRASKCPFKAGATMKEQAKRAGGNSTGRRLCPSRNQAETARRYLDRNSKPGRQKAMALVQILAMADNAASPQPELESRPIRSGPCIWFPARRRDHQNAGPDRRSICPDSTPLRASRAFRQLARDLAWRRAPGTRSHKRASR